MILFQTSNFTLQTYYQYHPLNRKISDLKLALQEKLPAEDVQALEELVDLCCDSGVQESAASFDYGFKLGAQMMMEVMDEIKV